MFKRNKVIRSRQHERRMDRNALIATFGGAALGVGLGVAFNGAAGGGIGFYLGAFGFGGLNRLVIEPLNNRYHDWCAKIEKQIQDNDLEIISEDLAEAVEEDLKASDHSDTPAP